MLHSDVSRRLGVLLLVLLFQPGPVSGQQVLPRWQAGELDIHHISTGEGDAALLIFPDGTTLLVDAGDGSRTERPPQYKAPPRPDDSRPVGERMARYIQRVHPHGKQGALDYVLITHFHGDHLDGLYDLVRHVRVQRLLDRGWPDYDQPRPFRGTMADRYRALLEEQRGRGMEVERFEAGRNDQIVLRRRPERHPSFEVRNLAVNGQVWAGEGQQARNHFPEGSKPGENPCSAAIVVRYGRFAYSHGGDLIGVPGPDEPAWHDLETPIAQVLGRVDVHRVNHHGFRDAANASFLRALQPRVHILHVWAAAQPWPDVYQRLRSTDLYPGPRDVFATAGMWEGRREHMFRLYGEEEARRHMAVLQEMAADQGHIVVRVNTAGDAYRVIVVDDGDETMRVLSEHGPYTSHSS